MRLACAATDVQQPAIRSCSVTPPHVRWLISSTKEGDRLERCRDEDAALVIRRGIRSRWLRSLRRDARSIQKLSCACAEIAMLTSTNRRNSEEESDAGIKRGTVMRITEYLAATILVALIVWAVLGLLMQES